MATKTRYLSALAITTLLASFSASAADVEWKFYTYFGTNDKPTELHKAFAQDLYEASNERFKIRVFSSGELPYSASDVLKTVSRNQVQMGDVALGYVAGDIPQLNVFSMPFVCPSDEAFYDKAIPLMEADINEGFKKFKTTSIMQWAMPQQQLWLKEPISGVDGLKGLKVRAWNREQTEMMHLFGGAGVSITAAEVVPSLQRGVTDGAFTAAVPALDWKFNEITKMGYIINMAPGHMTMAVNDSAMNKLPADLKELLIQKAREWAPKYRDEMISSDQQAMKTLAEKGMQITKPTDEDMEKLRSTTRPMWDEWANKNGPVAQKLLTEITHACNG